MDLELVIGGIALPPIIAGLIQLAKKLGLPDGYAPVANLILQVVGYGAMMLLGIYPEYLDWVVFGLKVAVGFLTAAGFYTTVKHLRKK